MLDISTAQTTYETNSDLSESTTKVQRKKAKPRRTAVSEIAYPLEAGNLVVIESEGGTWYSGPAKTNALPIWEEDRGEQLVSLVPTNANKFAVRSGNNPTVKRSHKQRASAKVVALPQNEVFAKAAEFTKDSLWYDILIKKSRNIYRKGFKYYPISVEEIDGIVYIGRLTYRAKSKDTEVKIPEDPKLALEVVKKFMSGHLGLISDTDQARLDTLIRVNHESTPDSIIKTWAELKSDCSKTILARHYVDQIKKRKGLSNMAANSLMTVISMGIASEVLNSSNIHMQNGAIGTIDGIEQTGEIFHLSRELLTMPVQKDEGGTGRVLTSVLIGSATRACEAGVRESIEDEPTPVILPSPEETENILEYLTLNNPQLSVGAVISSSIATSEFMSDPTGNPDQEIAMHATEIYKTIAVPDARLRKIPPHVHRMLNVISPNEPRRSEFETYSEKITKQVLQEINPDPKRVRRMLTVVKSSTERVLRLNSSVRSMFRDSFLAEATKPLKSVIGICDLNRHKIGRGRFTATQGYQ